MTERLHFHFSLSCIGGGNGTPLQYSCLENPRDGGAWWAAVYGVAQSRTQLKPLRLWQLLNSSNGNKSGVCSRHTYGKGTDSSPGADKSDSQGPVSLAVSRVPAACGKLSWDSDVSHKLVGQITEIYPPTIQTF